MRFWIETENLAEDTGEVSDYFYALCKQKAERDGNQIWESPDRKIRVIAVVEPDYVIANLDTKLATKWSAKAEDLEKVKSLDDIFRDDSKAMLIKIYHITTNAPDWLHDKKDRFDATDRVSYYKRMFKDTVNSGNFVEEMCEIERLRNIEGIPTDVPSGWLCELSLINGYKLLEKRAPAQVVDKSILPTPPLGKRRPSARKKAAKKSTRKSSTREKHKENVITSVIDFVTRTTQGETVLLKDLTKDHNLSPGAYRKKDKNGNIREAYKLMREARKVVIRDRKGNKEQTQDFLLQLLKKLPK
jgi:hypothetical protein